MKKAIRLVALFAILAVFALMAIGSGSDKSEKVGEVKDSSEKVGEVGNTSSKTSTEAVEETEAAAEIKEVYKVGDILAAKGLEMVYAACGTYETDNEFLQPKEGNKYIFFKFYIENKSDSDKSISFYSFSCYADGYQADAFYGDDDTLSASLSPGRTTSGTLVFEVPKDAKEIELEYEDNFFSDHKIKFMYEGDKDSGYVPEPNTTPTPGAYKVGDVVETKTERITLLSAETFESDNMFIEPKDGCEFIACEMEFENISDSDQTVSSLASFGCFADGAKCDQHYLLEDSLDGTISAGRKIKGKVAFEVPKDAKVVELEYINSFFTSDRIVFTIR